MDRSAIERSILGEECMGLENKEITEVNTPEEEKKEKQNKKKRVKRSIYDITPENDMKYRGPLSYRYLRVIAWISIAFSQLVLLIKARNSVSGSKAGILFGDTVNSMITSLGLPLLLIASFAVLLNGRGNYKMLLIINGSIAGAFIVVYMFVYFRYALGIVSVYTSDKIKAIKSLDKYMAKMPDFNGYIAFNIFIDLFLLTLFMFFMDYTPKKRFLGKKLFWFRMMALIPFLYEIVCIVLKLLATDGYIVLPVVLYPFLTTKAPLAFLLFVTIILYFKGRENRFIKHGKTHEDYKAFLKTNANSFRFSCMLTSMIVLFAILDLILYGILIIAYFSREGISLKLINDPAMQSTYDAAVKWAESFGTGDMIKLLPVAPIMMLFSYTKTHKNKLIDSLVPVFGVMLIVIVYIEGLFEIIREMLKVAINQTKIN